VLSSYIASITSTQSALSTTSLPHLPSLERTLSQPNLNILELGAGCGIVGITLSHVLPSTSQILLTDLPEASEILTHNLSLPPLQKPTLTHQILDWSFPLPLNVSSTKWNLIVVADCTYNPDVVPDLVKTLRAVAEGNREVVVLLAMKVRHESELIFFDLMTEAGFEVEEKCGVPLPVVGGEGERIEIFVFRELGR
jgi:predicted nicotinamide N-methyase